MGREEDEQAMKVMTGGRESRRKAGRRQHELDTDAVNQLLRLIDLEIGRLNALGESADKDQVGVTPEILELLEKTVSISPEAMTSLRNRLAWRLGQIAEVGTYL